MALTVVHAKHNAVADDAAASAAGEVLPSDWNANHTITGDLSTFSASPTASIGLTAVNGSAATFMRSDGAPTIDQTAAFAFSGLGATNVTALLSSTVNSTPGYVFQHNPTDALINSVAFNFGYGNNIFVGQASANYDDSVWVLGINVSNNATQRNGAQPAIFDTWESKFWNGSVYGSERHITGIGTAGTARRMMSFFHPIDGSTATMGLTYAMNYIAFTDAASNNRLQLNLGANNATLVASFTFNSDTNAVTLFKQKRGDNGAFQDYPFIALNNVFPVDFYNSPINVRIGPTTETGSEASPSLYVVPKWNTSGSPTALLVDVITNTASGAGSLLLDLQLASVSQFKVSKAGNVTATGTLTTVGGATLHTTSSALTDGAGVATGTLATAPSAGNPTKWIGINDNGTTRYIPAW